MIAAYLFVLQTGLAGIAVEAGRSLVLERAVLVAEADAHGLFVTGILPARAETGG